jgi:L-Ala-D/L-Glu epimerase
VSRTLKVSAAAWPSKTPFRISGHTWSEFDLVLVEVTENGRTGRGEAAGVYYLEETASSIQADIAKVAKQVEQGAGREDLRTLLQPGGARCALDCALWDLEAKAAGKSAWELAGVKANPVTTVFTIGLEDTPEKMAAKAREASDRPLLKLKLNDDRPVERVQAIRAARPEAKLVADCNGGWSFAQLKAWAPELAKLGLSLLEQPLPRGGDAELEGYKARLPLFADEACLHLGELGQAARRYDGIVIKLDKTGGLTEALMLARGGKEAGLRLMVGCMVASSLSMAPAHVLAQLCEFVDIDGPLLMTKDYPHGLKYEGATVTAPPDILWGAPR